MVSLARDWSRASSDWNMPQQLPQVKKNGEYPSDIPKFWKYARVFFFEHICSSKLIFRLSEQINGQGKNIRVYIFASNGGYCLDIS